MRVLLLGYGSIGKKHYKNLLLLGVKKEDIDVVDQNYESWMKAKSVDALEPNMSTTYDLVMVCTPSDTHEFFMHYFNSRRVKRLFIEKPLFLPPSYNQAMKERGLPYRFANKTGQIFVNNPYRFDRGLIKLKETLPILGKIKHATLENSYSFKKCHPHLDHKDYEGVIYDDIHIINVSQYLFGSPSCILSHFVARDFACFDWIANDIIVSHMSDMLNERYKKRVEVRGEFGTLIWNFKGHELFFAPCDGSERRAIAYKKVDHLFEALKWVIEAIKEDRDTDNLEEAIKDMEVCEKLCQK